MQIDLWLWYTLAIFIVIGIPGPLSILMVSNVVNYGFRSALYGIGGGVFASLILISVSALGLGAIIGASPTAYNVILYAGAAYLLWLGIQSLRVEAKSVDSPVRMNAVSAAALCQKAFWLGLSNPKDIIFFVGFLPRFLRPEENLYLQLAVMLVTWVGVELICKLTLGISAHWIYNGIRSKQSHQWFNRVIGVFFITIAMSTVGSSLNMNILY